MGSIGITKHVFKAIPVDISEMNIFGISFAEVFGDHIDVLCRLKLVALAVENDGFVSAIEITADDILLAVSIDISI